MDNSHLNVAIIAGPNGSGKSTCGPAILQEYFDFDKLINADIIASGLSAFHPDAVAIQASRIMLQRIRSLRVGQESFAFETTLASRSFSRMIKEMKAEGYQFTLLYLWLNTPELAVSRVAERVILGGHSVPEDVIRRRYRTSICNFFDLYQPLADNWYMVDNSERENLAFVASGVRSSEPTIYNKDKWERIQRFKNE
jgi:predicted ABC-type ATPase